MHFLYTCSHVMYVPCRVALLKFNCINKKLLRVLHHKISIKATICLNTTLFAAQGENKTINNKYTHYNMGSHNQAVEKKSEAHFIKLIACL